MPEKSTSAGYDQVFIRDLSLLMSVGIYDHERTHKQRVIINIVLNVRGNAGKALNSIADVVSYEDIVKAVRTLAQEQHYDLLESFAEQIAQICLNTPGVLSADISIEKPDIFDDCTAVGVQIHRSA